MNSILLTGLVGSNPLAALAAFGLVRNCRHIEALRGEIRLGWQKKDGQWIACVTVTETVTDEEFLELLSHGQEGRSQDDIYQMPSRSAVTEARMEPARYMELSLEAKEMAFEGSRDLADFLMAISTDLVLGNKSKTKQSQLCMTAGRQTFLGLLQKLAESIDPLQRPTKKDSAAKTTKKTDKAMANLKKHFREALFGPWEYRTKQHALGWDPAAEQSHAYKAKAPTSTGSMGVLGAIWLAVEALPLFPTAVDRGRTQTANFTYKKRGAASSFNSRLQHNERFHRANSGDQYFCWPIWGPPIKLDELQSLLLNTPQLLENKNKKGRRRGIYVVYGSKKKALQQGRSTLSPGELICNFL